MTSSHCGGHRVDTSHADGKASGGDIPRTYTKADLVSRLEERAAVVAVESAYHVLDAGRVLTIDARWRDGRDTRDYLYADAHSWVLLACGTNELVPDDRWLSIAASFEFLAQEE